MRARLPRPFAFITIALTAISLVMGSSLVRHPASAAPSQFLADAPRPVDPALERLLSTLAPGVHVVSALAIDIDHDGDLDLVASTREEVMVVWINDGQGHFSAPVPTARPASLNGRQAAVEASPRDREPALAGAHAPSGAQPIASVPADLVQWSSASDDRSSPVSSIFAVRTPRAPPRGPARRS